MGRRSPSSSRWLQRQAGDAYVKQRQQEGYRSRAAYKLRELTQRDKLLRPGLRVLDLGAAPGGWTQVAAEKVGARGTVVALDVLKMDAVPGATVIQGDCREEAVRLRVREALGGEQVDLVMSDMAPNITGIAIRDEAAAEELAAMCLEFAREFLRPGGALLIKLFEYAGTEHFVRELRRAFDEVSRRKPDASRARSREFYVVARGFVI
ncbi:MAG: RlmE family RNA methyltransferase [Gammaproteobacteria bacterium]|nr:RlmE family RNA methyltransferase [Gammaproteobacteria bacterium]